MASTLVMASNLKIRFGRAITLLIACFCAACLTFSDVNAQGSSAFRKGSAATDRLLLAVGRVINENELNSRATDPVLAQIQAEVEILDQSLRRRTSQVPLEFETTISDSVTAIEAAASERDVEEKTKIYNIVLLDIRLKNSYLAAGLGAFPFQKDLLINVAVSTFRGGSPDPGYRVGLNPLRDRNSRDFRFPFSSSTNNAQRKLPPGLYVMTLSRGEEVISQTIEIGEDGTRDQSVRIEL